MNVRSVTLAALALLVGACAPETPDDERPSGETAADRGQTAAARSDRPDYGAAEAGRPDPAAEAGELTRDVIGKMVVDADGQLLGTTKRVVRKPDGEEKLAVVSVSGTSSAASREVIVPLAKLGASSVPGKLELKMTQAELLEQPDAARGDYVALEEWMTGEQEVPAADGRGGVTSREN